MDSVLSSVESEIRRFENEQGLLKRLEESWRVTTATLFLSPLLFWPAAKAIVVALVMRRVGRHARDEVLGQQRRRLAERARALSAALDRLQLSCG